MKEKILGLLAKLPEQRKSVIKANLKRNWYFPISAMAFFCLNLALSIGYCIGLLLAVVISLLISSQISSIWDFCKKNRLELQIISVLTALAVCWSGQSSFCLNLNVSSTVQALRNMLPDCVDIVYIVSIFGAVISLFFIYFWGLTFWKAMTKIIKEIGMFKDIKIGEIMVYALLFLVALIFTMSVYARTDAFYGTEYANDIIYTCDSPALVKENVYLVLTHPENDLRQPLFAVFAAPFIGIPYLIGKTFGASAFAQALLINGVQIVVFLVANYMLSRIMRLSSIKRLCFMLLASCTYTYLLFILSLEQYIVAYFWLVFCLYLICEKRQPNRIAFWGAGGTLLTSMILIPFMSEKSPLKNFKKWFMDIIKYGLEFVTVLLVFCRFDVIFYLFSKISSLSGFTGKKVTLFDKISQYTEFIKNCFLPPNADVNFEFNEYISWQLEPAAGINFIGIAILVLVIISAILNRDKKSSLLSIGWVGYSVVILLVLGWGTQENGLILYSLYFGWPLLVLLFQLAEKIEDRLKVKWLVPAVSIGCSVLLAVVNIPAIMEMIDFAITYYPV